jgi:FG-GAP repeat
MRRAALVVRFVLLVATAATVSSALTRRAAADLPSDVAADFNHDGVADLAVGVLGENASPGR